jgi:hypothetical protein
VDQDHLIIPGLRIGPVHLGDRLDDAIRVWGVPTHRYPRGAVTAYVWLRDGFSVDIRDDTQLIVAIAVSDRRDFATPGGTVVTITDTNPPGWYGSTPDQVRREFGPPGFASIQQYGMGWSYGCRGLSLVFQRFGSQWYVAMISVTVPERMQPVQGTGRVIDCQTGAPLW